MPPGGGSLWKGRSHCKAQRLLGPDSAASGCALHVWVTSGRRLEFSVPRLPHVCREEKDVGPRPGRARSEPRGSVSAQAAVTTGQTSRPRGQRAVSGGELLALLGTVQRPSKEGEACVIRFWETALSPGRSGGACQDSGVSRRVTAGHPGAGQDPAVLGAAQNPQRRVETRSTSPERSL